MISANREVIVSAGAIDAPKLLTLSGIGPAGHLTDVGVDVLVDFPGAGSHLQDHPEGVIQWEAEQPMVEDSTQRWGIVPQSVLSEGAGQELFPGPDVQTDEQIAEHITRTHNTVYHPAGSCRMGPVEDQESPLDPQLHVKGVSGLRVADASVMPKLVTVNPNITVFMIGERAAQLIAQNQESPAH